MTQLKTNDILKHTNRLSVQVSLTGHSFLVTSIATNAVVFFSEIIHTPPLSTTELLHEIQQQITTTEALSNNIAEVHIIYNNDIATVVPTTLFDESKAVEYLKFNSKILVTDFIANDTLEAHEAVVVYVPYININNYFFETYGSFEYYHATTLFLKQVLDAEKFSADANVYIDIHHDIFTVIITKNGKLVLSNTFGYKTPADFIYYVLFCYEQLELNPDETPITLSGYISEGDTLYNQLYTYVRTIKFAEPKTNAIITDGNPSHRHFLLKSFH